ncbi:hypothetical protein SCLARK_00872 [Spiroplasma clarkii]|nr:hypothetical protein SCLARK_00872 [Spiroplasma clarkii]
MENYNLKPIEIEYPLPVGETAYASLTTKLFYKKLKRNILKLVFLKIILRMIIAYFIQIKNF